MRRRVALSICTAALLLQCREEATQDPRSSAPLESTSAAASTAASQAPSASAPPTARPPAPVGEWLESPLYRFRLVTAEPCGPIADAASADRSDPRKGFLLGVTVEVEAVSDQVWMTPKAATLEKKGVVIQAELEPQPGKGCEQLLSPQRVLPGKSAKGTFVFALPNESYARSAVFAFEPPRWRGAPRSTVQMPDCVTDCDAQKKSKKAGSPTGAARNLAGSK